MKILLIPIGSAGDVFPFLGMGLELRRRGHDITVITNGYFEEMVRQMGMNFAAYGSKEEFIQAIGNRDVWHPTRGFRTIMRIIANHRLMYDLIRERFEDGKTLIVAHTLALAARIGQDRWEWPVVSVHPSPMMFRSEYEVPTVWGMNISPMPRWFKRMAWWVADRLIIDPYMTPDVNALRRELGLLPVRRPLRGWIHSPLMTIGMFPEWFAAPQPDWPPQARLAGFPLFDTPESAVISPEVEQFLGGGDRPIVFTPGSAMVHAHEFFDAAAGACARLKRRGMLLTRFAEQVPRNLPAGVRHFAFAPLSRLLSRCAAIVHHGGIGTTSAGFAAGVPQLLMPMSHDQPDNAARVKRLGVGDYLAPRRFRAGALAEKLGRLLADETVAGRCANLAGRCQNHDGINRICDLIEEAERFAAK